MKAITNTYASREDWLRAGANELRPDFLKLGCKLPEKIRFAIAFTSTGKRGHMAGECWHPESSADQHYEVIIRADMSDPVEVLAILVHELVHAVLPPSVKHGKAFRDLAQRVGLEGPMRRTEATPLLRARLQAIAASLGTLPHAKLTFVSASDVPKRQQSRHLKAECDADGCGYRVQISAKWARAALPNCPMNSKHGKLVCDMPGESDDKGENI